MDGTMYEDIVESLRASRVIEKGGYSYFVHPLSNGIPKVEPALINTITDWMVSVGNIDCDLILAPEAMGIQYATALSLRTGIPFSVIRKTSTEDEGEISITQRTGYSKSNMYINGVTAGTKVVIVDDVISTGGTLNAIITAIKDAGAVVVDVLVPVNKDNGASRISDGTRVKTLFDISVENGAVTADLSPQN